MSKEIEGTVIFENKCDFAFQHVLYETGSIKIEYAVTLPDQCDSHKFKKNLDIQIQKELAAEQKTYNSFGDQIRDFAFNNMNNIENRDRLLEQISTRLRRHEADLPRKLQTIIQKKCAKLAEIYCDKQYVRQIKVKAAANIVAYSTLALSQTIAALAAVGFSGGLATPAVAPTAISAAKYIADGMAQAFKNFQPIGDSLGLVNSKMLQIQNSGNEIKSLLETHQRRIAVEGARLKDLRITANRLKSESEQRFRFETARLKDPNLRRFDAQLRGRDAKAGVKRAEAAVQLHLKQVAQIDAALQALAEQAVYIDTVSKRLATLEGFADGLKDFGSPSKIVGWFHKAAKAASNTTPYISAGLG